MPTPTNPHLLDAIRAITATDTPQTRQALYEALLNSTLILPTTKPVTDFNGTFVAEHDLSVELQSGLHDGHLVLFVFTDADALHQWRPEGSPYIVRAAAAVFQLALTQQAGSIQINPAGAVGGYITTDEIVALARGIIPGSAGDVQMHQQTVQTGTQVMIGAPTHPLSIKVAAQLQRSLSAHSAIAAGYVFMLVMGSEAPQQIAGIVFNPPPDDATRDAVMRQIASEVTAVLKPNMQLAFMVLNSDLLHSVCGTVHPAYVRQ